MSMLRIVVLMLILVHSAHSRRRHFGGASSSSSGHSWSSDYSNGTRVIDNGEVINVIPIPVVINGPKQKNGSSISGKVRKKPITTTIHDGWRENGIHDGWRENGIHDGWRENGIHNKWRENRRVMNGEKLYKNDPRYYPCSIGLIKRNWDIISNHLYKLYPFIPSNVNVTLICINEKDYGFSDLEFWIRDELGLKCLAAFWLLVLVGVIIFLLMRKTN